MKIEPSIPHRKGGNRKRQYYRRTLIKNTLNRVLDCHLSPEWRQMAIENTVSTIFWSAFVDCSECFRLPPIRCVYGSLFINMLAVYLLSSNIIPVAKRKEEKSINQYKKSLKTAYLLGLTPFKDSSQLSRIHTIFFYSGNSHWHNAINIIDFVCFVVCACVRLSPRPLSLVEAYTNTNTKRFKYTQYINIMLHQ